MSARCSPRAALIAASAALAGATVWASQSPAAPSMQPSAQAIEFFESNIRPLLIESCFDCHTDDEKGGLRLDSRERMVKGGESGPAIVPGDPDASLLMRAVRHAAGVAKMPRQAGKLTDAQIAALATWIKDGAAWPAAASGSAPSSPAAPKPDKVITDDQKAFW